MLSSDSEKRLFKSTLKRRMIEILISIPFGIGFAALFWYVNLSLGLQLFLTVVCWGVIIGIIELIFYGVSAFVKKRNIDKPKRKDPFAD